MLKAEGGRGLASKPDFRAKADITVTVEACSVEALDRCAV